MFFLTPDRLPGEPSGEGDSVVAGRKPLVGLLETFRTGLVGGAVVPAAVAVTALAAVLACALGSAVFTRRARAVRDVV